MNESEYPYVIPATPHGECKYRSESAQRIVTSQESCGWFTCEKSRWIEMLRKGPLVVGIDGSSPSFQHYKSGDIEMTDCANFNHAVVAYAYKNVAGLEVVTIRNSWGMWGNNGEISVLLSPKAESTHQCYIMAEAWLPIVTSNPGPNPNPTPVTKGVTLYEHCPFDGFSFTTDTGSRNVEKDIPQLKDSVSSIKVNGSPVSLFLEKDCMGESVTIFQDNQCLAWDYDWNIQRFNDRVKSFMIEDHTLPPANCIWVYQHCCYTGGRLELCGDQHDLNQLGFDDKLSSIKLGHGVESAILFFDAFFDGFAVAINRNTSCLKQGVSKYINNQTSSIRIINKK
jgi:hypothetical protein